MDLHPEIRALVNDALTDGYLSAAEAAYRKGDFEDYYLFLAGRLRNGVVPVQRAALEPLGPTGARKMFCEVERLAGVQNREDRAFYGLRRQATDLAPEFAQDARVLNRLTGHLDSATRERVYQDPHNERVQARAAQVRREMREHLRGGPPRERQPIPHLSQHAKSTTPR